MSDNPKLCCDCRYYRPFDVFPPSCAHERAMGPVDLVDGSRARSLCMTMRAPAERCGVDGKLFERRPTLRERVGGWLRMAKARSPLRRSPGSQ